MFLKSLLIIIIDLKRVDINICTRTMKSNFQAYLNIPNIIELITQKVSAGLFLYEVI